MQELDLIKLYEQDPNGDVRKTGATQKVAIAGEVQNHPVYQIRASLLRYNQQNDRIASWISEYKDRVGELPDSSDLEGYNEVIERCIVKSNEDAIKKTEKNIALVGQRRPGTVLSNGLVIDGNRRFTCIRRLAREAGGEGWLEAVILPRELGDDRKKIKMLELSIQHGEEERVGYDPIDRLVGIYNDILNTETRLLAPEEYAENANMPVKEVRKQMEQAEYMVGFLEFAHAPKAFYLARDFAISGPFGELPALLKKCKNEQDREDVRTLVYANILAEPQGDITRFIRRLKPILDGEGVGKFLELENDIAAQIDEVLEEADDPRAGIMNVRASGEIVKQLQNAVDDAEAEVRRQKAMSSPVDSLRKAARELSQVQSVVYPSLKRGELEQIASVLDLVCERVEGICNEFEPYRPAGK